MAFLLTNINIWFFGIGFIFMPCLFLFISIPLMEKHNISRRLDNKYIKYNVYINGSKKDIKVLDNNLKGNKDSKLSFNNNAYLIYEGKLDNLSEVSIKIGMWVDYETITNEYMNSGFVGTVKVYVESLS